MIYFFFLFLFTICLLGDSSASHRYLWFGSGTKRNSIMTILGATLEFIRKGITDDDNETPMNISPGASPSTSMMQESTNSLLDAAESVEGPSPKNMTSEEGNLMVDCLQRWQGEVDRETESKLFVLLVLVIIMLLITSYQCSFIIC